MNSKSKSNTCKGQPTVDEENSDNNTNKPEEEAGAGTGVDRVEENLIVACNLYDANGNIFQSFGDDVHYTDAMVVSKQEISSCLKDFPNSREAMGAFMSATNAYRESPDSDYACCVQRLHESDPLNSSHFEIVGDLRKFFQKTREQTLSLWKSAPLRMLVERKRKRKRKKKADGQKTEVSEVSEVSEPERESEEASQGMAVDAEAKCSDSEKTPVFEWSSAQVEAWMIGQGGKTAKSASNFREKAVTGQMLLLLENPEDLLVLMPKETKTTRKAFLRRLKKLKQSENISRSQLQQAKLEMNRDKPANIIGLRNLGNTCFLNSAIQVLLQTPRLVPHLWQYAQSHAAHIETEATASANSAWDFNFIPNALRGRGVRQQPSRQVSMLAAVAGLVSESYQSSSTGTRTKTTQQYGRYRHYGYANASTSPDRLVQALARVSPRLCDGRQHDSADALSTILNTLDDELNQVNQGHTNKSAKFSLEVLRERFADGDGAEERAFLQQMFRDYNPNRSIVRECMNGILRHNRKCVECGHESSLYETFGSLHIPIRKPRLKSITVCIMQMIPIEVEADARKHKQTRKQMIPIEVKLDVDSPVAMVKAAVFHKLQKQTQEAEPEQEMRPSDSHSRSRLRFAIRDMSLYDLAVTTSTGAIVDTNAWLTHHPDKDDSFDVAQLKQPLIVIRDKRANTGAFEVALFTLCVDDNGVLVCKGLEFILFNQNIPYSGMEIVELIKRESVSPDYIQLLQVFYGDEYVCDRAQYNMNNSQQICLVAVWKDVQSSDTNNTTYVKGRPKIEWENYDLTDLDNHYHNSAILQSDPDFSISQISKILKSQLDKLRHGGALKRLSNTKQTTQLLQVSYGTLRKIFKNQQRIAKAIQRYANDLGSSHTAGISYYEHSTGYISSFSDITTCLQQYFSKGIQVLPSCCKQCGSSNSYVSQTKIAYAPTNLVLRVKRETNPRSKSKNTAFVKYPAVLPLTIQACTGTTEYSLYGVCCHDGSSHTFGHYYSCVKCLQNDTWYLANDSQVRKLSDVQEVVRRGAILLLYVKQA